MSNEYLEGLLSQQVAERYNEWQNTTGAEMTDGLKDDFYLFQFGEQLRQLEASEITKRLIPTSLPFQEPHTQGPPSFTDYTQVSLSCLGELFDFGFSQLHNRQLIGLIIGQEGKYFNWLTETFGAHYIWFNSGQCEVLDEDLETPTGEHYWNGRIEIWAHPSVIEGVRQSVINHVSERISHFAIDYVLEHCRYHGACLPNSCSHAVRRPFQRTEVCNILDSIDSLLYPGITLIKWGLSHDFISAIHPSSTVDIDYLLKKAVLLQCDAPYDTLEHFIDQLESIFLYSNGNKSDSLPLEDWYYDNQMDYLKKAMDYQESCHWCQDKWTEIVRWLYNEHYKVIREENDEDLKTEGEIKELMEQWCYFESELVKSIIDKYKFRTSFIPVVGEMV